MTEQDTDIVIVGALRTPIGNFLGGLASLPGHKLGEIVIKELIARSGVKGEDISEIILGQVLTGGAGQNPARQASVNAGVPVAVPAWCLNQVCGSGLRSVALASQAIKCGDSSIVIAGGQESMSQSKHAAFLRDGVRMGDSALSDMMIKDGLWDAFKDYHMGITAENVAAKFSISREMQDQFSLESQQKAASAQQAGVFNDELVPVTITTRKGDVVVAKDEFVKADTTLESLSKLRPAFNKEGTVTAGNASGINDGAAALMLMTRAEASKRKLTPLATIVSWGQSGVEPEIMGTGPIIAVKKALAKAGWQIGDLDMIEANEAFAAQAIAVNKELRWDTKKVNVSGGAIALGHPIGASGARILTTLVHGMKRQGAKKGIATLCVGGGMGVAVCIER